MKKIFSLAVLAVLLSLVAACSDENVDSRTPVASVQYDVSSTQLKVNESMAVTFTGVADLVSIYTGDEGHRYEYRDSMETGVVVNKGYFTYSYSAPGVYHVVCVASTFDTYMGDHQKQDTCSFYVKVTDDVTEFTDIYTTITPNTYYASKFNDDSYVLALPTKQVYNNRDIVLNPKRQRIYYNISSDSTLVFIDLPEADREQLTRFSTLTYAERNALKQKVTSSKVRYDLSTDHLITVRSYEGTIKDYHLYCLIYPEFKSVKVNGVTGVLSRDAYDQSQQTYTFTLPTGTDPSKATIEYQLDGSGTFLSSGEAITSGAVTDLTNGTFTIERTSAANSEAKAVSNVKFVFNYK
jgi:hypothetical protein